MNDPDSPDVQFISHTGKLAVLSDNTTVPVTHWFGYDGVECEPAQAVSCVAGDDEVGWFAIDLVESNYARVH
ncbi:MAG TPA: hypothetical protein VIG24_05260 [Acidimicrobiia bacterium]